MPNRPDRIEHRARFDLIRYANVWEDAEVLREALLPAVPLGRAGRFLSIASGGDNAFALLASGAEVVAADLSPAQIALVELKRAAIRRLQHPEALAFLGALQGGRDRRAVYESLEPDLPESARDFWRARPGALAGGVLHHGRFEEYFRLFRERVLPLVHRRATVDRLLEPKDDEARRRFYRETWDNRRWRLLFRLFFSRFVMGRLGRDPEFFRYVQGSVAERILARTEYALTALPVHPNPYLEAILRGEVRQTLPCYLRPEVFPEVKRHLDRLTLYTGPVDAAAGEFRGDGRDDGFDGFNLSDVFEYLDEETSAAVYGRLLDAARPGARLAYWNMLVPRRLAPLFPERARPLDDEARRLFARDRAFFYSAFVLDEALP
jgi:S-adenosylmethionine-diacylglycerol 3-amino-3-carboxypropyl transferase